MVIFGLTGTLNFLEAKEHLKIKNYYNHSKTITNNWEKWSKKNYGVWCSSMTYQKNSKAFKRRGLKLNKNLFVFWLGRKD